MADSRDLQNALEAARLRISAAEEWPISVALDNIEKRIAEHLQKQKNNMEAREPYELN